MKLWYSKASPFARKALAVLKHQQLENQTELLLVQTTSFDPDSPHNQDNPLGRIPALQRYCGNWLFGSLLIAEYLDQKGNQAKLFPPSGKPRWAVLALHNLVDGILENTTPMLAEKMLRPENQWWTSRHQQLMERNIRSFAQLETALAPFATELNIGTLTAVCLIDWWQFRNDKLGYDLVKNHPNLTAWAAEMNARYAVLQATKPSA